MTALLAMKVLPRAQLDRTKPLNVAYDHDMMAPQARNGPISFHIIVN